MGMICFGIFFCVNENIYIFAGLHKTNENEYDSLSFEMALKPIEKDAHAHTHTYTWTNNHTHTLSPIFLVKMCHSTRLVSSLVCEYAHVFIYCVVCVLFGTLFIISYSALTITHNWLISLVPCSLYAQYDATTTIFHYTNKIGALGILFFVST